MDPTIVKTIAITVGILAVVVVLPMVGLFLEHQRKMARLMRGEPVEEQDTAVVVGVHAAMAPKNAAEVKELRERVQTLEQEVAFLKSQLPPRFDEELRARSELQS